MKPSFLALCAVLPLLAACSGSGGSWLTPHRIDIRQGNLVTQEMVSSLKPGLTKDQVRFMLGTPLVADIFHADRWDYVYRFVPGRHPAGVEQRHLAVFFQDGRLVRVEGDVIAAAGDAESPAGAEAGRPAVRVIEIAPAKTAGSGDDD